MAIFIFRGGHGMKKHHFKLIILLLATFCAFQIYRILRYKIVPLKYFSYKLKRYKFVERVLAKELAIDRLSGCHIPKLDNTEDEKVVYQGQEIKCRKEDWVTCIDYTCLMTNEILKNYYNIQCKYKFIIYNGDHNISYSSEQIWFGNTKLILTISDHAYLNCTAVKNQKTHYWSGLVAGFRPDVTAVTSPPDREKTYNVLILGFHGMSRYRMKKRLPKSFQYLTKTLKAAVFEKYNIVGPTKSAAILPMLTGKSELEFMDMTKTAYISNASHLPLIFPHLEKDGYHSAYFEDIMPKNSTFHLNFKGFSKQPTKHYLYPYFVTEMRENMHKWSKYYDSRFCSGGRPRYKLMLDLTEQFFKKEGKRFCFTFINNIQPGVISTASIDTDIKKFLVSLNEAEIFKRTMLMVIGDYGPRRNDLKHTLQAKLERHQPLLAIRLPDDMTDLNTILLPTLLENTDKITSPYDIYPTLLDVTSLYHYWNEYKVPGSDMHRGISLLEPIPATRSCSEAAVEPHLCFCNRWLKVHEYVQIYKNAANFLVQYINSLTNSLRLQCAFRTLVSVLWVIMEKPKNGDNTNGAYLKFQNFTNLQVKVRINPGNEEFEAPLIYLMKEDMFIIDQTKITATLYNQQLPCINNSTIEMFCYCLTNNLNENTN